MASVVLDNLCKTFPRDAGPEVHAVREVSLDIPDKEFLVLVGPSGCGKTTTLRLIAGLESPGSGEIRIDGVRVNEVPPKDRDVAMVFQNYALYPHMSAFDNMAFGLRMRNYPKAEIQDRVLEAARMLDLVDQLPRKPKSLSGGQRQRVALGRAIVRRPKVFLFDEPLSNLDAPMRVQMRAELSRLHRRLDATMIYVTHDQVEAMTLGDRIAVLREGSVQQVAPPAGLYREPANAFVAGFLGSPPMNLIRGTVVARGREVWFEEQPAAARTGSPDAPSAGRFRIRLASEAGVTRGVPASGSVVLGIRPEHLELAAGTATAQTPAFEATVDLVEVLGSEILVHLLTAGHRLVARAPLSDSFRTGAVVSGRLDTGEAVWFDAGTGDRIKSG